MTVLIADDEPFTRQALNEILTQEGFSVTAADNGPRAWELYQAGRFDLVCLDIMMPGLSGYDVCKKIRAADARVPVLFISAKAEEFDKVLGLELGADDFIVKPFGAREVVARVRAVLRRSQPAFPGPADTTAAAFAFGPWEITPGELRARQPGTLIDLTPRELSLLQFLAARPGQAVSRVSLFEHCWGWDQAPQSRTVDQHMAVLRKKLEADPARPRLITTVQGVGYRYEGA